MRERKKGAFAAGRIVFSLGNGVWGRKTMPANTDVMIGQRRKDFE